jgi:hypothetical protein
MERDSTRRVVRDLVRLTSTEDRAAAFEAAAAMVADGFTAWVFEIDHQAGKKTYRLLNRLPLVKAE